MEKIEKCIFDFSYFSYYFSVRNHRYRNRVFINRHRDQVLAKFNLTSALWTIRGLWKKPSSASGLLYLCYSGK